ncbi:hypothetical protein ElyMa_000492500 [Elysia marginata]|uniref:Uncharacterized protein n=1 Tax=Elysia marginata TaxID=1093978 RepID=A0AAV4FTR4_9GAST|nr:hypothetical protein ElyMa_000492500 [Elysia marginata]
MTTKAGSAHRQIWGENGFGIQCACTVGWRLTPLADTFSAIFSGPVSLSLLSSLTGPPNSIIPSIKLSARIRAKGTSWPLKYAQQWVTAGPIELLPNENKFCLEIMHFRMSRFVPY